MLELHAGGTTDSLYFLNRNSKQRRYGKGPTTLVVGFEEPANNVLKDLVKEAAVPIPGKLNRLALIVEILTGLKPEAVTDLFGGVRLVCSQRVDWDYRRREAVIKFWKVRVPKLGPVEA